MRGLCTARHRSGECYIATDGSECERTVSACKDKLRSQFVGEAEAVQWPIGYIARIRDRQGPLGCIAGIRDRPGATGPGRPRWPDEAVARRQRATGGRPEILRKTSVGLLASFREARSRGIPGPWPARTVQCGRFLDCGRRSTLRVIEAQTYLMLNWHRN